jgi:hypothetical protein
MTGLPHNARRCGSIAVCHMITVPPTVVVVPVKQTVKGTPLGGKSIYEVRAESDEQGLQP